MQLLWLWEKGVIKDCDYKTHRIFTLRCISKDILLVSVKLRSACSKISQGARKIIEKAEKRLLQDTVRCINNTIEDNVNTINNSRSRLASLVTSTTDLYMCSKFFDKIKEERYGKVKDRQVKIFSILVSKSKNNDNNSRVNKNNQMEVEDRARVDSNNSNSQSQDSNSNKWVTNLSKTNVTEGQRSVLAKGPNFSITPRHIPSVDYITAVESIYPKLKEEDAMELRAEINSILRKVQVPKPNVTRQERLGLAQLKKDKDRVILTADKGVAMVIMDREDYINKAESLLSQPAYRLLLRDPTNKIKAKHITKLRRITKDNNLEEGMHKAMYPTGCIIPKFYGLPKIQKTGNPLRPIVSSRGSITYGVAKVKC